ncbi:hypothetical protein SAMN05444354_10191 [Stigmatella aurantiaca]|uniref:Uncharacterized protein n=2 Tax=Stigmatella aurantiaca TaxID=41 RepID=A0A1H7FKZ5_STIAU|nr:hypothetical protein SAMN05444354_10191 [Stigmatella aurantiaca]
MNPMNNTREKSFQPWFGMSLAAVSAAWLLAGCGPATELSGQAPALLEGSANLATCTYQSLQSRVQPNAQTPWNHVLTITLGQTLKVGSFYDGTGLPTTCCTTLTVVGPNGYVAYPGNLTLITLPDVGIYTVTAACGGISDTATVTVKPNYTVIPLTNANLETQSTPAYGFIDGWGPNGAWASHADHPANGRAGLGTRFGYYSAGTQETVGQLLSTQRFKANTRYTFRSYAQGGGDNSGVLPYQLGYAAIDGDLSSFVPLATAPIAVGANWVLTSGVTYLTPASGTPLGKQVIVRFGQGSDGGVSDIWFDNLELRTVP